MKRRFTPFFSSDGGQGLDLAISQKIVKEHNGFIYYGCEPGSGAAFLICLPIMQPMQEEG